MVVVLPTTSLRDFGDRESAKSKFPNREGEFAEEKSVGDEDPQEELEERRLFGPRY